jgi:hypothetical protein
MRGFMRGIMRGIMWGCYAGRYLVCFEGSCVKIYVRLGDARGLDSMLSVMRDSICGAL